MIADSLSFVLRRVVGERLRRSFNGQEVWRDDRTWRELASEVSRALAGSFVILDKTEYRKLVADAEQMRVIRACIDEYKSRLPKEKAVEKIRNPYVRWMVEHNYGAVAK